MRNIVLLFGMFASLLAAEESSPALPAITRENFVPATTGQAAKPKDVRLWKVSVTALAAANALDVHSSWGKHELNSVLSNSSGKFGGQGALLKAGVQGGLLGLEYLISRGHPSGKVYRVLSVINFSAAGVIGGVAAHNYTIPRR